MTNWQKRGEKVLFNVTRRIPVTITRGRGVRVWDDKDNEYIDFVGGWAVCVLGHCHPVMVNAINKQAKTLIQTSHIYYTMPYIKLAELLVKNSCFDRVFMGNSGLEANEGAVKLARRYGKLKLNGAYEVITAFSSFHGRSLAMTAATGQPKYQEAYQPLPVGFTHVPFNDIEALKAATTPKTCAIMLEPLQGEGGVNLPAPGYLKAVRQWCDEKGILLIFDEIQTGMGRLGTLWGYQTYGVEPDIMTLSKGLGGGVPIGALLAKESCAVFQPGDHGTTFGGNPLTCATALAVVDYVIKKDVPGACKKAGQYLIKGLKKLQKKYPFIKEVRGQGLLVAFEFDHDIAADVLTACLKTGVLVNAVKPNAIRIMPALVITEDEIDEGITRIDQALASIVNPEALTGKKIAVVAKGEFEKGKKEAVVFTGIARWENGILYMDRRVKQRPFEFQPEWLNRIKPTPEKISDIVQGADFYITLSIGPLPDDVDPNEYVKTGLKWPKK